jgi:hypothetical protein
MSDFRRVLFWSGLDAINDDSRDMIFLNKNDMFGHAICSDISAKTESAQDGTLW